MQRLGEVSGPLPLAPRVALPSIRAEASELLSRTRGTRGPGVARESALQHESSMCEAKVAAQAAVAAFVSSCARGAIARRSYEPFGGIYARDYALRRYTPRPEQSWLSFPLMALALSAAWQVFHNWTQSLIALSILSFLAQCYAPEWEDFGVLTDDTLRARASSHRLVTSAFLHASWYHLAVNMYFLWYYGHMAERLLGPGRFLFAFLASAVGGSLASITCKQRRRDSIASLGGSAAALGLVAAVLVFRMRHGTSCVDLWSVILASLLSRFFTRDVDIASHLGGCVSGGIVSYLWGPRLLWSYGGLVVRSAPIITWPFT